MIVIFWYKTTFNLAFFRGGNNNITFQFFCKIIMKNIHNKELLIKKLLYQSSNRGCKETDFIIGKFAKKNIYNMNYNELLDFKDVLENYDSDIYDWYTNKKELPKEKKSSIMLDILKFKPFNDEF